MEKRAVGIIKTLFICLVASSLGAIVKILFGNATNNLSFVADGVHSVFDSTSTVLGMISIIMAAKPPDEDHPYGHQKVEIVAAMILALLLFLAAHEVSSMAWHRLTQPEGHVPIYSPVGLLILGFTMMINIGVALLEKRKAAQYQSQFLRSDSAHNASDFLITTSVLVSLICIKYNLLYIDAIVSIFISLYLVYLCYRIIKFNISPLIDSRVIDPQMVRQIATSVEGVQHCHAIRSRGMEGHQFLDLNIHLSGAISLNQAHKITHEVEDRLKAKFPDLVDVVIHTEPHNHPPCSRN